MIKLKSIFSNIPDNIYLSMRKELQEYDRIHNNLDQQASDPLTTEVLFKIAAQLKDQKLP